MPVLTLLVLLGLVLLLLAGQSGPGWLTALWFGMLAALCYGLMK